MNKEALKVPFLLGLLNLALILSPTPGVAASRTPSLELQRSFTLTERLGRDVDQNVLKLFRAAADSRRDRLYVAGLMTRHIGILDTTRDTWVGTVDSGIEEKSLKYLFVDPARNRLYVRDASHEHLVAIDLSRGRVLASIPLPGSSGTVLPDPHRDLVYVVTRESPGFRALNGEDLSTVYTSDAMGGTVHSLEYDPTTDSLLALDGEASGPRGVVHRFDLANRRVVEEIELPLPAGVRASRFVYDPDAGLMHVLAGREIRSIDTRGVLRGTFELPEDVAFDSIALQEATGLVLVLVHDRPGGGEVATSRSRLLAIDPVAGTIEADLETGRKAHQPVVHARTGRVYIPNGDASVVWSVSSRIAEATPVHLGDSIEQVVLGRGERTLWLNSRLGGSRLVEYSLRDDSLEVFTAGTWPIPVRSFQRGRMMVVLNAWDATLSVFSSTRDLLGTIELGVPRGTTDRLPDLAIDSRRALAAVAYPEHGKVVVVDLRKREPVGQLDIDGIPPGDVGGGPGQLQVVIDETTGTLYVWQAARRIVDLFDIAGRQWLGRLELPGPEVPGSGMERLFVDSRMRRVFIGDVEIDGIHREPTGRRLQAGARIFALDRRRGIYWADGETMGEDGPRVTLFALDRDSLSMVASFDLGLHTGVTPQFALTRDGRSLYAAWMSEARLDVYGVD